MISIDESACQARRGRCILSGTLFVYEGKAKDPRLHLLQRLNESLWASRSCVLSDSAVWLGDDTCIPTDTITCVDPYCEMGDFVFQVYRAVDATPARIVYTLRAPTYSDLVDWCEALKCQMQRRRDHHTNRMLGVEPLISSSTTLRQ